MPDYLSSMSWRMSGGVFGQPPRRPYFQTQYARKQYPTRTGLNSVAIGERDSASQLGRTRLALATGPRLLRHFQATDEHHSNYKSKLIAYLARKSKILLSKNILFAAISLFARGSLLAKHSLGAAWYRG
jgi:hypothetical protein